MRPTVYDLEAGAARDLPGLPPGYCHSPQFVDDDRLVLGYTAETMPTTVLLYDLRTERWEDLLPPRRGPPARSAFVGGEHVHYPDADGLPIPVLLYRPRAVPPGARLPALVRVHGGPYVHWTRGFDPFLQLLVDRGFVVLAPNVRGSSGYGRAFRDAALGDWGGKDLADLAAGAAFLAAGRTSTRSGWRCTGRRCRSAPRHPCRRRRTLTAGAFPWWSSPGSSALRGP